MPAFVPAAARTLNIFETFAREQRELSNADLANLLQIADSSCSDLLHTLQEQGYLVRTARSRRFYPTDRLLSASQAIAEHDPLGSAVREALELISQRTGETALCGKLEGLRVNIVGIHEGRYELRYIQSIGTRVPAHVSALGRVLLASLPVAEADLLLEGTSLRALTPDTVVKPSTLRARIRDARRDGVAFVDGEGVSSVASIAVAGLIGEEALAISLAGPSQRISANREKYSAELIRIGLRAFRQTTGDK
ncbi:MAG: IclR family transcriptional regulator [Burkholderiaceae bacterium]